MLKIFNAEWRHMIHGFGGEYQKYKGTVFLVHTSPPARWVVPTSYHILKRDLSQTSNELLYRK